MGHLNLSAEVTVAMKSYFDIERYGHELACG